MTDNSPDPQPPSPALEPEPSRSHIKPQRLPLPIARVIDLATLLVVLTAFVSPWQRDLFVGDETRYAQVLREMIETGSILVPVLDGAPFAHKPPVHFWLLHATSALFGLHSTWSFVLPSLFSFLALTLLVRRLGTDLFDPLSGSVAAFLFATSWLPWGVAQTARMDPLFVLLITGSILFLWRALQRPDVDGSGWRNLLVASLLAGGAVLVKGPMALVIFFLNLFAELVARRRALSRRETAALIGSLLIPLVWLIPAVVTRGSAYAGELLFTQNLGRLTNAFVHREPGWYYLARYPAIFFPWFVAGAVAIVQAFPNRTGDRREERRFCLFWLASVFVPFSLMSGKLDVYLLPAFPPFVLLIAWQVGREGVIPSVERGIWVGVLPRLVTTNRILLTLIMLIALSTGLAASTFAGRTPEVDLAIAHGLPAVLLVVGGIAGIALLSDIWKGRGSPVWSCLHLGLAAILSLTVAAAFLMPMANEMRSSLPLVRALDAQRVDGSSIMLYDCPPLWSRSLPPHLEGVRHIGPRGLREASDLPVIVVTRASRATELGPPLREHYTRVETIRIKRRPFGVYRLKE